MTATGAAVSRRRLHVSIAVLTYRRPDDLADALPRLVEQARSVADACTTADVLVVDNDPAASARGLVRAAAAAAAADHDVVIHYQHEAVPGIAAARNRALTAAADAHVLAFIDDDERPCEEWLRLMLGTYRVHGCAAVVGPVVSQFSAPPPDFVTDGRFFDRLRHPTGSLVTVAATNNLLLDLDQIRSLGLQFDTRFGTSGGSDTLFTRQLHRRGGRLVWCDEAVVTDMVPPSRATGPWVLRRAVRSGNTWSRTSLALTAGSARRFCVRLGLTGRGLLRLGGAAAMAAAGVVAGSPEQRARAARTLARSTGMLLGAWGWVYSEYSRPLDPQTACVMAPAGGDPVRVGRPARAARRRGPTRER